MEPLAHLIIGDPFLAQEAAKTLVKKIIKSHTGEVQESKYQLSDRPLEDILREARNLPFLAEAQIFILRNAEGLKEKHVSLLKAYFESPSKSTYLIFQADELDRRSAFSKLLDQNGQVTVIENSQKNSESSKFIQQKLKQAGKTIAGNALARLQDQAGDVPSVLESILNQLIIYSGEESQITFQMVEKFEEKWQDVDVFQLVNAIVGKKQGEALILVKTLVNDISDLMSVLGLLHWQIKRYWLAKRLLENGESQTAVAKHCRISPKQAPYFWRQLKLFSLSQLETALEGLFELDLKNKTGQADGFVEIEKWVVETTS